MSDYFSALLRSSGMTLPHVAGSVRSVTERLAPAEAPPGQPASLAVPSPGSLGEPGSQPVLAPITAAARPVASQTESESTLPLRQGSIPDDMPQDVQTLADESNPLATPSTSAAEEASPVPQPPLAHELIDAALRWVAAGEQPGRSRAPVRTDETMTPNLANRSKPGESETRGTVLQAEAPSARAHPIDPSTAAHERSAAPLSPLRSETPSIAPVAAALDREPPIDISIGAIHVRVDAPAAQTAAQPPAPRQVVAPRTAPGRSALARRALRRI